MFSKLINFIGGDAALVPPLTQPLYPEGAAHPRRDEDVRARGTNFEAPRPATRTTPLADISTTKPEQAEAGGWHSSFVRREAIFSHQAQRVIGHEFALNNSSQLRSKNTSRPLRRMHDELLLKSILALDNIDYSGDELVFIHLSPDSLDLDLIPQLPGHQVVLAFHPGLETADKLVARCHELRNLGFRFALDDLTAHPGHSPLLDLADYVRFDVGHNSIAKLSPQLEQIPGLAKKTLIAKNVHTPEAQKTATLLSFNHYQGSLFGQQ